MGTIIDYKLIKKFPGMNHEIGTIFKETETEFYSADGVKSTNWTKEFFKSGIHEFFEPVPRLYDIDENNFSTAYNNSVFVFVRIDGHHVIYEHSVDVYVQIIGEICDVTELHSRERLENIKINLKNIKYFNGLERI